MPASITLIPNPIYFGSVNVGANSPQSLNIQALGFGPWSISSVANGDAEFSSDIGVGPLSTGANNFTVNFAPASTGVKYDSFTIMIFNGADDSTNEYDLSVSGTGTSPPPPAATGFVSIIQES
jgi:hypothetical protein